MNTEVSKIVEDIVRQAKGSDSMRMEMAPLLDLVVQKTVVDNFATLRRWMMRHVDDRVFEVEGQRWHFKMSRHSNPRVLLVARV